MGDYDGADFRYHADFLKDVQQATGIKIPSPRPNHAVNKSSLAALGLSLGLAFYSVVTEPEEIIDSRVDEIDSSNNGYCSAEGPLNDEHSLFQTRSIGPHPSVK